MHCHKKIAGRLRASSHQNQTGTWSVFMCDFCAFACIAILHPIKWIAKGSAFWMLCRKHVQHTFPTPRFGVNFPLIWNKQITVSFDLRVKTEKLYRSEAHNLIFYWIGFNFWGWRKQIASQNRKWVPLFWD